MLTSANFLEATLARCT